MPSVMNKNDRYNSMVLGLVLGLLLPVLTLLVILLVRFDGELAETLRQLRMLKMIDNLLSLSAIPNLLLFFVFIWRNRNFSARGVIFATLILAFVMLIFKVS